MGCGKFGLCFFSVLYCSVFSSEFLIYVSFYWKGFGTVVAVWDGASGRCRGYG